MKIKGILLAIIFTFPVASIQAADVSLEWDPVAGSAGYDVLQDDGAGGWTDAVVDVTDTTVTVPDVPEDRLVLFKVASKNSQGRYVREFSGAWYDHRNRPLDTPGGTGIE